MILVVGLAVELLALYNTICLLRSAAFIITYSLIRHGVGYEVTSVRADLLTTANSSSSRHGYLSRIQQ